jgi:hypothetical protein
MPISGKLASILIPIYPEVFVANYTLQPGSVNGWYAGTKTVSPGQAKAKKRVKKVMTILNFFLFSKDIYKF